MRKLTIVGEENHAFGVPIETSHRKNTNRKPLKIIGNGRSAFRIVHRSDNIFRFIKQDVELVARRLHGLAANRDRAGREPR